MSLDFMKMSMLSLLLICALLQRPTFSHLLSGERLPCHEGTNITDTLHKVFGLRSNYPCISCSCVNGTVKCGFRCPKSEGCYRLIPDVGDRCSCKSCQGCRLEDNVSLVHGGLVREGCRVQQCDSGVVTVTEEQCHVPCAAPLPPPPGECCPACPGCRLEGRALLAGETATLSTDPCVTCRCLHNSLVCTKVACPVLSCPPSKRMKQPGHCCPECVGHRDAHVNPPGGHCLLANHLQYNGSTSTHLDQCASCTCMNNNITCTRRTCPPLTCPVLYQVAGESGDCCPVCRLPEVSLQCAYKGVVYEHGSEWRLSDCASCTCSHGQVTCVADPCPSTVCPLGYKLEDVSGSCCPRCVAQHGACLAFGMPHYKTFDGLHYDFQGDCKYTLAKDCSRRSKFQLKIINHPHSTNSVLPFMRSLVLKLHLGTYKIKVTMMVSRKTKVNGSRVQLPYRHRQDVLVIDQVGHGIQLNTTMGLQLLWDGESYIELVLDSKWQNKTCGLCGNFNGDLHDDLTRSSSSREAEFRRVSGSSEAEADDLSLTEAARSWARGRCSRRQRDHLRESPRSREQRLAFCSSPSEASVQRCDVLNSSALLACHEVLPTQSFIKACVDDMCRCSGERQCQCGAIMAYARECHRLGVSIPSWRNVTKCGGLECPRGAEYMECAPACRPTCRNPHPNPDCHTRRCSPGCYCPFPTVLHRGACIPTSQCPDSESQNLRRKSQRSRRLPSTRLLLPRSRGPSSKRGRVIGKQDIFQEHRLLSSSVP